MEPVAPPALADNAIVTVNRAFAAQLLKSMFNGTVALALGAKLPAAAGSGEVTTGLQGAPPTWANAIPLTWTPNAAAGPLLPTWMLHTRSLLGPLLRAMFPKIVAAPDATKDALILCGAVIMTVVLELEVFATLPVQLLNA